MEVAKSRRRAGRTAWKGREGIVQERGKERERERKKECERGGKERERKREGHM